MKTNWTELDRRAVDTARLLAADAVQKVGNGHPGTAMSLAPAADTLFQKVMRHDPADPEWTGRDRFVLSPDHSSLTLYTQLFLAGYELEPDDLKAFRTHGSKTPGHPEYGHTAGVETTTGPLGQGVANAVGMAMAARYERGLFDPDAPEGTSPFDHTVWAIVSTAIWRRASPPRRRPWRDIRSSATSSSSTTATTSPSRATPPPRSPCLNVVRPADANETAIAWAEILRRHATHPAPHGPALTRQGVPTYAPNADAAKGGYVLRESSTPTPDVILLATGSEVRLAVAVAARERLEAEGVGTRVVSMPSVEWFEEQPRSYRESVLPRSVKARVAVEAGIGLTWYRYVGDSGRLVPLEHFGASADAETLFTEYGFTPENVVTAARESLAAVRG